MSIHKTPSGKWQTRWRDRENHNRAKTFDTRVEAEQFEYENRANRAEKSDEMDARLLADEFVAMMRMAQIDVRFIRYHAKYLRGRMQRGEISKTPFNEALALAHEEFADIKEELVAEGVIA